MKITTKMRNYHFGVTFKLGDAGILVLGALGALGSVILFTLGMAWVLMGAYQQATVNDSRIAWGIVMMCMGSYLVLMNTLAVVMSASALHHKTAHKTLWIAICAIFALVPLIPAIVLLFTPLNWEKEKNLPVSQDFHPQEKERLQYLKGQIDQGVASPKEEQEFRNLLARYRQARRAE